jgi:hypothetical protein
VVDKREIEKLFELGEFYFLSLVDLAYLNLRTKTQEFRR